MKTDRELLELAASSIGLLGSWSEYHRGITYSKPGSLDMHVWSPLTNDGDALRLAAKLVLNVLASEACIVAEDENGVECIEYMYGPEDYTSGWRRAITRAAAAIGESMQ